MTALPPQDEYSLAAGDVRARVAARPRRRAADAVIGAGPPRYEDLQTFVSLVRQSHGALIAAVSIITPDRQTYLAIDGIDVESTQVRDEVSFCAHIVAAGRPLVVADALRDRRFVANPFVADHVVGSYAGVPLRDARGFVVGTLCVFQAEAGDLDASVVTVLTEHARTVQALLRARAKAPAPRKGAHGRLPWAARRRAGRRRAQAIRLPYRFGRGPRRSDARPVRRSRTPWANRLAALVVHLLKALLAAFTVAIVVAASVNQATDPVHARVDIAQTTPSGPGLADPSAAAALAADRRAPSAQLPQVRPSETRGLLPFGVRLPELDLASPEFTVHLPDPGVVLSWGSDSPSLTEALAAPGRDDVPSPGASPGVPPADPAVAFIVTLAVALLVARRQPGARTEPSSSADPPLVRTRTGHELDEAADADRSDAPDTADQIPEPDPGTDAPHACQPNAATQTAEPNLDDAADAAPQYVSPAVEPAVADPPAGPDPLGHPPEAYPPPRSSPGHEESSTKSTVVYVDPRRPDVPVETVHVIRIKKSGKIRR